MLLKYVAFVQFSNKYEGYKVTYPDFPDFKLMIPYNIEGVFGDLNSLIKLKLQEYVDERRAQGAKIPISKPDDEIKKLAIESFSNSLLTFVEISVS